MLECDLDSEIIGYFNNKNRNQQVKLIESTRCTVGDFQTLKPNTQLSPVVVDMYGLMLMMYSGKSRIRIFDVETYELLEKDKHNLTKNKVNHINEKSVYWNLRIEWDILLFPRLHENQFSLVVVDFKDNTIVDYNSCINNNVMNIHHLKTLSDWLNQFEEKSHSTAYSYTVSSTCPKQTSTKDSGVFTILAMHSLLNQTQKYDSTHIDCARLFIARAILTLTDLDLRELYSNNDK